MQCSGTYLVHCTYILGIQRVNQGNVFLLNQRPHAKIQLIWMTFKKRPKLSLTIVLHKTLQLLLLSYLKLKHRDVVTFEFLDGTFRSHICVAVWSYSAWGLAERQVGDIVYLSTE